MTRQREDGIPQPTDRTRQIADLPSSIYSLIDIDLVVHRHFPRDVQVVMLIEQKAFNAAVGFAQRDTYRILDQMLSRSNGVPVVTERGIKAKAYYAGWHVLTLSGKTPQQSDRILWDGKQIPFRVLVGLLSFKFDPQFVKKTNAS